MDDYAKKHSNKMPKSLQTRCRNGGMQLGEGCMMAVNTSYTYISPHPYIFFYTLTAYNICKQLQRI